VQEALRLGTRIALLAGGRLELIAKPDEFRRAKTSEALALLDCLTANGDA
jgi:ABC-type proline/glycine betaine transport system ATPase subunit